MIAGDLGGNRPQVLPGLGVAVAFRPEFLDFERGIRVGNLKENERVTRILKQALETRYGQPFVTERWGRGVYWQWIGYLPRANRTAKPVSNNVSFGCSKFFLTVDAGERLFKCGLQVERGYAMAPRESRGCQLRPDWDWNRLLAALKPKSVLDRELRRLVRDEGFTVRAGSWEQAPEYSSSTDYRGVVKLRKELEGAPKRDWVGFQLFYAIKESEVRASSGLDLIESMLAVFREVTPAMNCCMQVEMIDTLA